LKILTSTKICHLKLASKLQSILELQPLSLDCAFSGLFKKGGAKLKVYLNI